MGHPSGDPEGARTGKGRPGEQCGHSLHVAHSCRDGEKGRGEARRRPRAASAGRKGDGLEEGTEGEGWREP